MVSLIVKILCWAIACAAVLALINTDEEEIRDGKEK
jgi:hypothetical protein